MGNRAVITFSISKTTGAGLYLHWSGSLHSVLALCDTARELGYRDPEGDGQYAMARLIGLACFADGLLSDTGLGVGQLKELDCDNGDNGVYVIGAGWRLVKRWGAGAEPLSVAAINAARSSVSYRTARAHLNSIHGVQNDAN